MNIFPSIGSTVTDIKESKSGTSAKIEFSDGAKIYIKYDAVILNVPNSNHDEINIVRRKPFVHMHKAVNDAQVSKLLKKKVKTEAVSPINSNDINMAKLRSESRIEKLSNQYDKQHPSGEKLYNTTNGM